MLLRMPIHKEKGFTLIELMAVVLIIAILSAIALPSYQNSVRKGRRQVAISDMLAYKQMQERYRNNNMQYATIGQLVGAYNVNTSSDPQDYTFSIDSIGPTNYRIIATAQARQNKGYEASTCPVLYLTADDSRTPADCWAK
jgi:type IV pilus assembly protein PilE